MNKRLKVYGWRGYWAKGGNSRQGRHIVAAASVTEVMRLTGMTRYQFNNEGCETGNEGEIRQAMTAPGTIFVRGLDEFRDEPWEEVTR